jgi:FMN phosphatase YigB (HAD superfamily)
MLKLCAFDLGNTLVNDALLFQNSVHDVSTWLAARAAVDAEEFRSLYEEINRKTFLPFISHTYGELEFFEETFALLKIKTVSPQEALSAYRSFLLGRIGPDRELLDGLSYLRSRGMKLAIISNERTARVDAFLEKTGYLPLFDLVVVSEAVGLEKPDTGIFLFALDHFGLRGGEAAMFGDNEIADGACRDLGMRFVLITTFKNSAWRWEQGSSHTPDYVIERINRESLRNFCVWAETPYDSKR